MNDLPFIPDFQNKNELERRKLLMKVLRHIPCVMHPDGRMQTIRFMRYSVNIFPDVQHSLHVHKTVSVRVLI